MYGKSTGLWEDFKMELNSGNIISRLILINVIVFLLANIINVFAFLLSEEKSAAGLFLSNILKWVMLPADLMQLLYRPWTLITHMFTHFGFFHLLFNMLWLYWFGRILSEFVGQKKILPLYIMGGLAGAILLIASYNIFPGLQSSVPYVQALGASAGVLAIVVGAATLVPDYSVHLLFLGSVRIKYIALVLVLIDLISIPQANTGGHIAHLGGAVFGYLFVRQMQTGNDWSIPFNNLMDKISGVFSSLSRLRKPRVVYKNPKSSTVKSSSAKKDSKNRQERVDEILDKISSSGYDSLTAEEKAFLFQVSKEE
ncbi:MAG: rhomboid family intramembrane serine protease [Chitinophagales bacterium]